MFKGWRRLFQRDRQLLAEHGGGAAHGLQRDGSVVQFPKAAAPSA
jgi:hypothetical protein